jgi:hypothetical protein
LCILAYLKTYPFQVVQGRLFGMGQSKAHLWMHVLLVVPQATLRTLGDAPTRSLTELPERIGMAAANAAAAGLSSTTSDPPGAAPVPALASPPFGHDGTERRIERPQDPTEQTRCDRG